MAVRLAPIVLAVSLVLTGCGGDDGPQPKEVRRVEEKIDTLPPLPRGYEEFVNPDAGIAFGRPPGWKADPKGSKTTLVAPDELVSAAITVDRTNEALKLEPRRFAADTASLVKGDEEPLELSRPKPFRHRYEGAIVQAKGVARSTGVTQRLRVVVLERKGAAVITAVVFENAEEDAEAEVKQALGTLRTLRTRPPA